MQIHIEELTFECIIGLLDFERVTPQKIIVTCKINYTYKTDSFINYAEVSQSIASEMKNEKFELIESALEYLSKYLSLHYPDIETLYLKITKPDILDNAIVSVSEKYNYSKT
jgi:dihydroneopterin aldolase